MELRRFGAVSQHSVSFPEATPCTVGLSERAVTSFHGWREKGEGLRKITIMLIVFFFTFHDMIISVFYTSCCWCVVLCAVERKREPACPLTGRTRQSEKDLGFFLPLDGRWQAIPRMPHTVLRWPTLFCKDVMVILIVVDLYYFAS